MIPKDRSLWDTWEKNLMKHDDSFIIERNQPETHQQRDELDEIFD